MAYLGRQPNTGVRSRYIFTATSSQTTFSGTDDDGKTLKYEDAAYLDVFLNGVLLKPVTDYTATTKTSVVLTSGAAVSDVVEIVAYDIANIANTVSATNGGTFEADVTVQGTVTADGLTVDTNTLYVDAANNRVGVGNAAPSATLDVNGTIKLDGNYPLGTNNTGLGDTVLQSISSGSSNTAIGKNAMNDATTASNNVAVGQGALTTTTSGGQNVALGMSSLAYSTTASNLTAVGYQAGYSNTTGINLTAVGRQAAYSNTTGANNTAFGLNALFANTTGASNVSIGLQSLDANTTGSSNTALGMDALGSNTTASNNTALGYQAGYSNTTGTELTFLGYKAGANTTGSYNTYVGSQTGITNTTGTGNTGVGWGAISSTSGATDNTAIGYGAGSSITTGSKNTIVGRYNGNQDGLDIRTSSNNIVLSDGDGDPLLYYHGGLSSPAWFMRNPTTGQWISQFSNESTNPYGLFVYYTNSSPNGSSNYFLYCTDNTTVRLYVRSNGNVANQNNSYGALSDEKLKENIVDSDSQWDDIKALRVRKYSLKADELDAPNRLGVVAQEVEAAGMGGLVEETTDQDKDLNDLGTTTKTVKYSVLYMKAVKALQEAMERIETLEAKVAALENA